MEGDPAPDSVQKTVGDINEMLDDVLGDDESIEESIGAFRYAREDMKKVPESQRAPLQEKYERAIQVVLKRLEKELRGE